MVENKFELHELLVRDTKQVIDLPLSKVLLMNDSNYPWLVLVPRVADIQDIYQLEWNEQQQLLNESSMVSEVMLQTFGGDKMNVAALGNVCPQLHVHHIVRSKGDACWPKPVWGAVEAIPYSGEQLSEIIATMKAALEAVIKKS